MNHPPCAVSGTTCTDLFTMQRALDCPERVDLDTDAFPPNTSPTPSCRLRRPHARLVRPADAHPQRARALPDGRADLRPPSTRRIRQNAGRRPRGCAPLIDLHEPGAGASDEVRHGQSGGGIHRCTWAAGDAFEIDSSPNGGSRTTSARGMGKTPRRALSTSTTTRWSRWTCSTKATNLSCPGVVSPGRAGYRDAKFADMHRTMPFLPNKYPLLESKIDLFKMAQHGFLWPSARGWKHYGDEVGARGTLTKKASSSSSTTRRTTCTAR